MEVKAPWEHKLETAERAIDETDPAYGCSPENRPIRQHLQFGIINLDKPPGPSSHEVAAWVKKILRVQHAGHGGTLEALTAGKIPMCPAYCL